MLKGKRHKSSSPRYNVETIRSANDSAVACISFLSIDCVEQFAVWFYETLVSFPNIVSSPESLVGYIIQLYRHHERKPPQFNITPTPINWPPIHTWNSRLCLVLFSGGLDSVFRAVELCDKGDDVLLFHVEQVNTPAAERERLSVHKLSKLLNLPLLQVRSPIIPDMNNQQYPRFWPGSKQWMKEHPGKNQYITLLALPFLIKYECERIAFGGEALQVKDDYYSDTITAINLFDVFIRTVLGTPTFVTDISFMSEADRVIYILRRHPYVFPYIASCLTDDTTFHMRRMQYEGLFHSGTQLDKDRLNSVMESTNAQLYMLPKNYCGLCHKCKRIHAALKSLINMNRKWRYVFTKAGIVCIK